MDPGSSHQSDLNRFRADTEPVSEESGQIVNADAPAGHSSNPSSHSHRAPPGGLWLSAAGGIRQHSQFGTLRDAVEYYDKSNALDSVEHRIDEIAKYLRSI